MPEMPTAPTATAPTTTPVTTEPPVLTAEAQRVENDNSNDTANVTEPSLQPILVEGKGLFEPPTGVSPGLGNPGIFCDAVVDPGFPLRVKR